jgi:hypothetical protein
VPPSDDWLLSALESNFIERVCWSRRWVLHRVFSYVLGIMVGKTMHMIENGEKTTVDDVFIT